MPRPKTKTKSEDLARIRNNQRRSRAKRLEYVRDLEAKAKKYDEILASNSSPSLSAFDKLQSENAWMRGLLATLGFKLNSSDALPGNIPDSAPDMASAVSNSFAGDLRTERCATSPVPVSFWEQWNQSPLEVSPEMGLDMNTLSLLNQENGLANLGLLLEEPNPEENWNPEVQGIPQLNVLSNSDTTLCSLACRWVIQCNAKGVELDVLYFRMERGFKQGNSPLEGCRVDNQVLLSVLTDIS